LTRVYFNIVIDKSLVEFAMRTSQHRCCRYNRGRWQLQEWLPRCSCNMSVVGACCLGHITIVYRLVFRHTKRLRWRSKAYGKCQKVTVEVRSLW